MSRFFTAKGDQGSTGLLGETRVPKSHPQIKAVGALDEASAALGMARALVDEQALDQRIRSVQRDLYQIMTVVALEKPDPDHFPDLAPERIEWLEAAIELYQEEVDDPRGFILPGDNPLAAAFGWARTVIRRAERETVELSQSGQLHSRTALPYLNRLSSLCFVLELFSSEQTTPASPRKS